MEDGNEMKMVMEKEKMMEIRRKPPGLAMGRRHHTFAQTLQREELLHIFYIIHTLYPPR